MYTLQDLQSQKTDQERINFCLALISQHTGSPDYHTAKVANDYDRKQNTTIVTFQKTLHNLRGQAVPDIFSANYRLPSGFFQAFINQQNQYLLGNGVTIVTESGDRKAGAKEKDKLGRSFDLQLQKLGRIALVEKCGFGFWNYDHLEVFKFTEFAPLYDEETGALGAGVRFWQIAPNKPLRFTLYELDGYTEYIRRTDAPQVDILVPKRSYKQIVRHSEASGTEIIDGQNYPSFPIIPLWGNPHHVSEIVGIREQIDCYDLIESGFANDLDDLTSVYWILHNAGGMDDVDLAQFIERMKTVHASVIDTDNGQGAEAHTLEIPYGARETYLTRLEADMYKSFSLINVSNISAGNKTATEIMAAYQPMDTKVDMFEYCVLEFINNLFEIVGIKGDATFKRNRIANMSEETTMVMTAASVLDQETILNHLPWLTPDEVDAVMARSLEDDADRFGNDDDDDPDDKPKEDGVNG